MNKYSTLVIFLVACATLMLASCSEDNFVIVDTDDTALSEEDSLAQLAIDNALIDAYLLEKGVRDYSTTDAGSRYYILEEGNGISPELNDIVSINFIGRYIDESVFDSNIESIADPEVIGKSNNDFSVWRFNYTIDGRQLGFTGQYSYLTLIPELKRAIGATLGVMDEESRAMIVMPSTLALGRFGLDNNADFVIPADAILLFEINLVQVRTN